MASCSRAGECCAPGRARASAASTRACTPPIQVPKSALVALASIGQWLEDLVFEHAHLLLRRLEPLAAAPGELETPLVRLQRLLERQPAFLHLGDDLLQLRERFLEGKLGGGAFGGFAHDWKAQHSVKSRPFK